MEALAALPLLALAPVDAAVVLALAVAPADSFSRPAVMLTGRKVMSSGPSVVVAAPGKFALGPVKDSEQDADVVPSIAQLQVAPKPSTVICMA